MPTLDHPANKDRLLGTPELREGGHKSLKTLLSLVAVVYLSA
jgi:hypothetical protein